LIVFVHGGGWRFGDNKDHISMARRFANTTSLPVCLPNYRLSPAVKHPTHTNDVHTALNHLLSKAHDLVQDAFTSLHLIGHSAGAHILGSLFLSPPLSSPSADDTHPSPTSSPCYACSLSTPSLPIRNRPSPFLVRSVKTIIGLAGVYDLDLLLRSFPYELYRSMASDGFGDRDNYEDFDLTTYELIDDGIRWAIVHSQGDSLVDILQPEAFYKRLTELYPNLNLNSEL
ncbi:Alpha/Beta hydrolase protein, partial [Cantharellus anzutake]|uniref:Alpha/Beta hydrolase protein n=1 Tax=Cantharellus anzutake TaxID=1750568 RepID=UPI00190402BA